MQAPGFQFVWLAAIVLAANQTAFGQGLASTNEFSNRAAPLTSDTTPAMQYFAGRSFRTASSQVRRLLPAPRPVQLSGAKPFQNIQRPQALSPYLGLDLQESELGIPNYHAYVRPQQQQRVANQAQAARIRQLNQQLRLATARGIVSNNPSGGVPTTGHSAQFLNMGGYFPAPQ